MPGDCAMKDSIKILTVSWISPMNKKLLLLSILAALLQLAGCAGSKEKVFGQEMPTMKAVHDEKFNKAKNLDKRDVQRTIKHADGDLNGVAKQDYQQLSLEFELLPNPVLSIYIYPHLTSGGRPVPGYSSYFKFYKQDQYALPGEVGGW